MNLWIIGGIIAGALVMSALVIGALVTADAPQEDFQGLSCSTCGNSCTAESNCGLSTCGAVSGSGSCGCN